MATKGKTTSQFPSELLELAEKAKEVYEAMDKVYIGAPSEVHALMLADAITLEHECLWVLCLNTRNRLMAKVLLYQGSVSATAIRVGEMFRQALILNASSIILVHNHPSGDPEPSAEDVAITRVAKHAGVILDVPVLDHIVIGAQGFVSLKTRGLGFD